MPENLPGEMELRLDYETPHFLHSLFSHDLELLRWLDEQLGIKTVTREGWILFRGPAEAVEVARRVMEDLEASRRGGAQLKAKDFRMAVEMARQGKEAGVASLHALQLRGGKGRKSVVPRSPRQREYVEALLEGDVVFGLGPAGTGKTYLAMAVALQFLREEQVGRVVLTRPAVEAGEALGFLPGDLTEKVAPYLRPLYDAIDDIMGYEAGQRALEEGRIEIAPLAYMRGRTLRESFVILDEAQNTTQEQMLMALTRLGEGSRLAVTGDPSQVDLGRGVPSGLVEAQKVLPGTEGVKFVQFEPSDVIRHPVVGRIIAAYDRGRERGQGGAKKEV